MLKTVRVHKYKNSGKLVAGPVYDNSFLPLNSDLSFSSKKPHKINRSTELDTMPYCIEIQTIHKDKIVKFILIRRWDERHLPEKSQDPDAPLEERIDITPAQEFNHSEKVYAEASDGHVSGTMLMVLSFIIIWFSYFIGWWPAVLAFVTGLIITRKTSTDGKPEKIAEIGEAKQRIREKADTLFQEAIQDINVWKALDGIGFENAVSKMFKNLGYTVKHTPRSNDKGVDLILGKNAIITIVQCKTYTKNIGVAAVRELHGSRDQFPDSENAMLVCLFGFSKAAKDFAEQHGIELFSIAQDYLKTEYRK